MPAPVCVSNSLESVFLKKKKKHIQFKHETDCLCKPCLTFPMLHSLLVSEM